MMNQTITLSPEDAKALGAAGALPTAPPRPPHPAIHHAAGKVVARRLFGSRMSPIFRHQLYYSVSVPAVKAIWAVTHWQKMQRKKS